MLKTIKMLNTAITLNSKYDRENDVFYDCYDTEFIVQADAVTTFMQIDALCTSFSKLKDTNSHREYEENRTIMRDKTKRAGTFIVKLSLADEIKFDEFMCKTDDFKSFEWYARQIQIEEKAEDFKHIT